MANELSTGKTIFILAVVLGCFAILWPKVFYPMITGSVENKPITSPNRQVSLWRDPSNTHFLYQLCFLLEENQDPIPGLVLERWSMDDCFDAVKTSCKTELTEKYLEGFRLGKDKTNLTQCLLHKFALNADKVAATAPPSARIKPYQPQATIHPHARPERPSHLHPDQMHPALREKGRAMPQRTIEKEARPGPMPGIRPPMGGGGGHHMVPPQSKGSGAMGIIMPLYTVGIVIFFMYTIMKVLFKRDNEEDDKVPKLKDFHMDPEYRKYVFAEEYLDSANVSHRDILRKQEREVSRNRRRQEVITPESKIGKPECEQISNAISLILADLDKFSKDVNMRKNHGIQNKTTHSDDWEDIKEDERELDEIPEDERNEFHELAKLLKSRNKNKLENLPEVNTKSKTESVKIEEINEPEDDESDLEEQTNTDINDKTPISNKFSLGFDNDGYIEDAINLDQQYQKIKNSYMLLNQYRSMPENNQQASHSTVPTTTCSCQIIHHHSPIENQSCVQNQHHLQNHPRSSSHNHQCISSINNILPQQHAHSQVHNHHYMPNNCANNVNFMDEPCFNGNKNDVHCTNFIDPKEDVSSSNFQDDKLQNIKNLSTETPDRLTSSQIRDLKMLQDDCKDFDDQLNLCAEDKVERNSSNTCLSGENEEYVYTTSLMKDTSINGNQQDENIDDIQHSIESLLPSYQNDKQNHNSDSMIFQMNSIIPETRIENASEELQSNQTISFITNINSTAENINTKAINFNNPLDEESRNSKNLELEESPKIEKKKGRSNRRGNKKSRRQNKVKRIENAISNFNQSVSQ